MSVFASVSRAQALDGREAGLQAAHQALNHLGGAAAAPSLAIVIASHQYQARDVASGVSSLLGEAPLIGFSTPAGLSSQGQHPHSVVVALLSGDFQADSHWLPGYAQSARETAAHITRLADVRGEAQSMLFFADGFNGDAEQLCSGLSEMKIPVAGALSSGDLHTGNTYQISGIQTGAAPWRWPCSGAASVWGSVRPTAGTRSEASSG